MPGRSPYAPAELRERRRLARRRRRIRRLGALGAMLAALAAVLFVVLSSGGAPDHPDPSARGAEGPAAARKKAKPPRPVSLPRGGRTLLPGHLIVAYYGVVGTTNILGRTGDPEADAAGVERQARAYARFGRPVQPAFELVTTIASPAAGRDDSYSSPVAPALVARYLAAAHRHKLLLILDFQPGRGEFKPQVLKYARFLLDPAVGVALDPEWKLASDEVPDQRIGSSSAASINAVSDYLSRVVARHQLPQKLFVIHEFRTTELPDRQNIATPPGLATVLQMDGLGPVATKLDSYRLVMRQASKFHPGFKVFLRSVDDPVLLTPRELMALRPRPEYISYQ